MPRQSFSILLSCRPFFKERDRGRVRPSAASEAFILPNNININRCFLSFNSKQQRRHHLPQKWLQNG